MVWNGRHADGKRKHTSADVTKPGRGARTHQRKNQPSSAHPDPEREPESPLPAAGRTGIVSVNGRDVERMHCRHS